MEIQRDAELLERQTLRATKLSLLDQAATEARGVGKRGRDEAEAEDEDGDVEQSDGEEMEGDDEDESQEQRPKQNRKGWLW
jgi:hypothetical protein